MNEQRWQQNRQVVDRRIGSDTILVPTGQGIVDLQCLYTLNDTGSFIWEQLAHPRTFEQVAAALVEEFEVTREQAEQDLTRFLEELGQQGCIVAVSDDAEKG